MVVPDSVGAGTDDVTEEVGMRLPLDVAGSELPLVEVDAEGLAVRAEVTACVVDIAPVVVDTAGVEELALVDCRDAEELTGGEVVHSMFFKYPLSAS